MRQGSRRAAPLLMLAWLVAASGARADGWEIDLDGRLLSSDANPSYTQGGISGVRFDSDQSGLKLGRARFALTESLGELWSVHLDASAWGDHDRIPAGLTEAFLQFRPYPFGGYRLRVKAGAFYPPISLENRAAGWESPYTLSYSAIDSWLAIEVRTLGVEAQLDWLGTRQGHDFDVGVTGGAFGWNEGAGTFIAGDGFTLTDRQTPYGGRVGLPGDPVLMNFEPFRELDGRAGVYGGLEARWLDRLVVRALRYDNRADPTAIDYTSGAIAWETSFTSLGARYESAGGWTAIAQYLEGDTTIAPDGFVLSWPFEAAYGLIARQWGHHTLSVRYDHFQVDANANAGGSGAETGHAWTAAYVYAPDEHWRFTLEWLHVASNDYQRAEAFNLAPFASETQLELAVRYAFGSAVR
ncbi:MAG TPA: hypothetical protein VGR80_06650 [Steroidobacteraceae bacterium]|nr:hypothetical protein [Steroidobacteraceae bacterium]